MRKTLRVIMAIISILVAVCTFATFAYRLGETRSSGERSSGAEYSILRNALISMQTKGDLQDQLLRNRLIALYSGSERLLAAQVLDESGLVAWKIPADSSYFALPNADSVRGGFSAPEWSTVVFSTPLSENMKLLALYATVRRSDISSAATVPLIIAGIWCLILAFAIVFLRKDGKSHVPSDVETAVDAAGAADTFGEGKTDLAPENAVSAGEPVGEPFEEAEEINTAEYRENSEYLENREDKDEETLPEEITQETYPTQKPAASSGRSFEESLAKLEEEISEWSTRHPDQILRPSQPKEAVLKEAGSNGNGTLRDMQARDTQTRDGMDEELREEIEELESAGEEELEQESGTEATMEDSRETLQEFEEISAEEVDEQRPAETVPDEAKPQRAQAQVKPDISNLPMPLSLIDSMLEERLSDELARNGKTDVSLMLIHCTLNSSTDPAALALAVTIKDYIGSKDLIFELYKGAFAVVLPSVDIGGTLKMSEDLADVLAATLSLYKDIEGDAPVFIGISSRAERKVDASKIYREASTALHKAFSGGHSRILAFRPKSG